MTFKQCNDTFQSILQFFLSKDNHNIHHFNSLMIRCSSQFNVRQPILFLYHKIHFMFVFVLYHRSLEPEYVYGGVIFHFYMNYIIAKIYSTI